MDTLNFPYTNDDISEVSKKTEMDALVAYMQVTGTAVTSKSVKKKRRVITEVDIKNPLAENPEAIARGKDLFEENCAMCHGDNGEGDIGPSVVDDVFLYVKGNLPDNDYYEIINNGTDEGIVVEGRTAKGGMPPFGDELQKDEIWSILSFIRSIQK